MLLIKNTSFLMLLTLALVLGSCGSNQKDLLCKRWQATTLRNPALQATIAAENAEIDTLGNSDAELQKTVNLDSLRKIRKEIIAESIAEQNQALQATIFEFNKNGNAYQESLESNSDSAKWTLENNKLTIDQPALSGIGDVTTFNVLKLTNDLLSLQLINGMDTIEMDFKPILDKSKP